MVTKFAFQQLIKTASQPLRPVEGKVSRPGGYISKQTRPHTSASASAKRRDVSRPKNA